MSIPGITSLESRGTLMDDLETKSFANLLWQTAFRLPRGQKVATPAAVMNFGGQIPKVDRSKRPAADTKPMSP